ncbi:MAG TPA: C25 family cysteine peptidase, partial [Chryseosolibacter sp.]
IRIQNPAPGTRLFDVTDDAATIAIDASLDGSLNAVVPSASGRRKLLATAEALPPAGMRKVFFRNLGGGANYVVITHADLRKPAGGYVDPVKAYAEYRSLPEGGGFDTLVVDVDQLYDQFNYGEPSPRAIFQFLKFLASVRIPDYLFLIGKGLDVNYGYYRNPGLFPEYRDLVPTAGYPASDMAFSSGLSGAANVPGIATGRLSATSPGEVAAYLEKVKTRDALPFNDLRRKKILHLSGGIEEGEPAAFRAVLQGLQSVAEDVYLGAQVQPVSKGSLDVKLINIADEINQGLGLITFFGHSAPNTLDFDIGLVSDPVMGYDNTGKYPFLFMNGCSAGSFFLNGEISGENWIKTPDKGAIGLIAHSSFAQVSSLKRYSSVFYDVAFGDSVFIKKSVGEVQEEAARRYISVFGSTPESVSQVQQMVLLGDPALKLFGAGKPDFAIDANEVYLTGFNGEPITAYSDSFEINIPVRNYGIAVGKRFRVEVTRQSADQAVIAYDSIFPSVLCRDTLTLLIRNRDKEGYGINVFSITVDADNLMDELSESNNTATFEYFIPSNSTRNLYPYNYSIVKSPQLEVSFQFTDLQAGEREFLIQIDTSATFDSGFKQEYRVTARVLGRQAVQLLPSDTTVYYWRTRIADPQENESKTWASYSFTFIKDGPEGWAQVHFPQFQGNESIGLVQDPLIRKLRYEETVSDIAIKTFSSASGMPRDSVSVKINGAEFNLLYEGGACRNNTINLVAFDRRSTQPYPGIYFTWYELLYQYGGRKLLCGREPYVINSFTPQELATGGQDDLLQYVKNIHAGDSVVLFNIGDAGYSQWPAEARASLAAIGVSEMQLAGIGDGEPVVIFGRKGSAEGTATIFRGSPPQTSLEVNATISGRYTSGVMSSPAIGPALHWDRITTQWKEAETADVFSFAILGITTGGRTDTLRINALSGEDLSFIDAGKYPFIRLVYASADDLNLTPVQLAKWLVFFEPVPEGIVFFRGPASPQVVAEGETPAADFGFVNVTDKTFSDSLVVSYDLLNRLHPGRSPLHLNIASPMPGDTTLFTLPFSTLSKEGLNDVEVFVNPRLEKEKSYDNNVMVLPAYVEVISDHFHPVLEVTFDGRFPENLEYVSPDPHIRIRLWDENPFLQKKDTLGISVLLSFPCEDDACAFRRINFSAPEVHWQPATSAGPFQVDFSPRDLPDGTYRLRVQAGDASGNASGQSPYEISFIVAHERTVVADAPHPNPFYVQTDVDVTVTGRTDIPYLFTFQILTVTGMLVREWSGYPEGLHTGKNRITWDGLGQDGRSLPGGIYVYRLVVTGGEQEREYMGRIVLLR